MSEVVLKHINVHVELKPCCAFSNAVLEVVLKHINVLELIHVTLAKKLKSYQQKSFVII